LGSLNDQVPMVPLRFAEVSISKWWNGRMILIGEASHAIYHSSGQGVAMSLETAAVLCDELSRCGNSFEDVQLACYLWQSRRTNR
jgi:FAD-dependent urate hydroxylase